MSETTYTADQLRAMLRESEAAERKDAEAAKAAFVPVFRFTLLPDDRENNFNRLFEGSGCMYYRLHGEVMNSFEAKAVGATVEGGGASYLYNTLNNRFVGIMGGGRLWLSNGAFAEDEDAWKELSKFIEGRPQGGDVTDLVNRFRDEIAERQAVAKAARTVRLAKN
jgi:hypothetical protein